MSERNCPECGHPLSRVTNTSQYLNDDQFDDIRAGDWYCDNKHFGITEVKYHYFWNKDFVP